MQHTNQYQFNLIESGDAFSAEPLNENAEKMEEALKGLSDQAHVVSGSYTGTGSSGGLTVTVGFNPKLVIIGCTHSVQGQSAPRLSFVGETFCFYTNMDGNYCLDSGKLISLGENGFTILGSNSTNAAYMFNVSGKTYSYFALC